MGKSINPMGTPKIRGGAVSGSVPSLIVLMSLQPAIPWRVALLQCPPPLHRPDSIFHPPAETVNHHLTRAGEFSTGRMRNFQPELTEKALSTFSLKRLPPKVALVTKTLLEGEFLDRCENVLAFGNPGSGKTHLLCAIGQELIARGRRIYFTTAALLVQDLLVAKRDLKLSRFIKRLAAFEGLIIDELGYVQQSREEMEVLFTLLAERYERGSVLISSNLPFSKWEGIFKDPMTTAAAIDRLVHHCVILELNIPSYRVEQAKKAKADSNVE